MSSNLPPGVTESMIPGNRPQDIEAERYRDELGDDDLLDFIDGKESDEVAGAVRYEDEDRDIWLLESDEVPVLPDWPADPPRTLRNGQVVTLVRFESEDDLLAYVLAFHDDEVIEQMITEHLEEGPPEPEEPPEPPYDEEWEPSY